MPGSEFWSRSKRTNAAEWLDFARILRKELGQRPLCWRLMTCSTVRQARHYLFHRAFGGSVEFRLCLREAESNCKPPLGSIRAAELEVEFSKTNPRAVREIGVLTPSALEEFDPRPMAEQLGSGGVGRSDMARRRVRRRLSTVVCRICKTSARCTWLG